MTTTFPIILLGLLWTGLVSAGITRRKNVSEELQALLNGPETQENALIIYKIFVKETQDMVKSQRRDSPVGKNDFELVEYKERRLKFPKLHGKRVKRRFGAPQCPEGYDEDYDKDGETFNGFELTERPKEHWLKGFLLAPMRIVQEVKDQIQVAKKGVYALFGYKGPQGLMFYPPSPFPPEECFGTEEVKAENEVAEKITVVEGDNHEKLTKLFMFKPTDFMATYTSKRQTGCSCDKTTKTLGCTCCYLWEKRDMLFCAGCGYVTKKNRFTARFTVEDFKIYEYKKKVEGKFLKKVFRFLSRTLCIPWQFSVILTVCVELSLGFNPDLPSFVRPRIELCPGITVRVGYVYHISVMELPCWELEIPLPFGQRSIDGGFNSDLTATGLTFDNGTTAIADPLKSLYAVENFEDIEALLALVDEEQKNMTKLRNIKFPNYVKGEDGRSVPAAIYRDYNAEARLLKAGAPTEHINWEPADMSKLRYMVVLYTQPLASPIRLDEEDDDLKENPRFRAMTEDAIERRSENDSLPENYKVQAAMGEACGGVLLTADKVLTICACIKYFYLYHKYEKEDNSSRDSYFVLYSKEIYVTFADRSFTADQTIFELDQSAENFMNKSECFEAIDTGADENIIQISMVVMTISPELDRFETLNLVPWLDIALLSASANMTIIGMKRRRDIVMYNASGYEFDPRYEVVNVPFESCHRTSYCRKGLSKNVSDDRMKPEPEFIRKTQCFCAISKDFQLCDGVVGFPVMTSMGLVGLSAIPMCCRDKGSMLAAALSNKRICEIKRYVYPDDQNPKECLTPNKPPPSPLPPTRPRTAVTVPSSMLPVPQSHSMLSTATVIAVIALPLVPIVLQ